MRTVRNKISTSTTAVVTGLLCVGIAGLSPDISAKDHKAVKVPTGATVSTRDQEMPSWQIPNIAEAAEAYYGPDSEHLIAQVKSPLAVKSPRGLSGFLTKTFTDSGTDETL
ncbi:MAG: hypothetical protein EB102_06275, partial [Gammaproteobacteria bacterium]|nr:hypothetical protein [Gammaproteobacteria bacterium]